MTDPMPRLDDATFEALFDELKARIPVHNPDWTNWSDADPGITILQLFAFMAESLLYRANQVPERNRQTFLRLVGLRQRPATAAEGIVTFDSARGSGRAVVVFEDTEVRAGATPFRTTRSIDVLPVTILPCAKVPSAVELDAVERERYLAMYADYGVDADDVGLYDTARLSVPAGAATYRPIDLAETMDESLWVALLAPDADAVADVRDQLVGRTLTLGILPAVEDARRVLPPRSVLRQVEAARLTVSLPVPEIFPVGEDKQPSYRELTSVEHGDVLVEPGTITVDLPTAAADLALWPDAADTEPGFGDFPPLLEEPEAARVVTWLRLRRARRSTASSTAPSGATRAGLPIAWVGVNAVGVVQRTRVQRERLGYGTGRPDQVVHLGHHPVLPESVQVWVGDERWQRIDDLLAAPPEVAVGTAAIAEPRDAGSPAVFAVDADGLVSFGTGLRGSRPAAGLPIVATYAHGGGRAGLVPAGAITTALHLPTGVKVTNEVPTWRGADAESLADAERRMVEHVRHRERAVTATDIRDLTLRTPGVRIGRCEVLPLFRADLGEVEAPGVITVLVIPASDPLQPAAPRPDRMFVDAVCGHLDPRRLVTTELHVRGPQYVPVTVSVGFDPVPGRDVPPVRVAVTAALRDLLSPLPRGGHPGWPLRRPLDERDILTEVARVPGVGRVNGVELSLPDRPGPGPHPLSGLELPQLVGLSVQPGDAVPVDGLSGASGEDPRLLPVPAIPEEC